MFPPCFPSISRLVSNEKRAHHLTFSLAPYVSHASGAAGLATNPTLVYVNEEIGAVLAEEQRNIALESGADLPPPPRDGGFMDDDGCIDVTSTVTVAFASNNKTSFQELLRSCVPPAIAHKTRGAKRQRRIFDKTGPSKGNLMYNVEPITAALPLLAPVTATSEPVPSEATTPNLSAYTASAHATGLTAAAAAGDAQAGGQQLSRTVNLEMDSDGTYLVELALPEAMVIRDLEFEFNSDAVKPERILVDVGSSNNRMYPIASIQGNAFSASNMKSKIPLRIEFPVTSTLMWIKFVGTPGAVVTLKALHIHAFNMQAPTRAVTALQPASQRPFALALNMLWSACKVRRPVAQPCLPLFMLRVPCSQLLHAGLPRRGRSPWPQLPGIQAACAEFALPPWRPRHWSSSPCFDCPLGPLQPGFESHHPCGGTVSAICFMGLGFSPWFFPSQLLDSTRGGLPVHAKLAGDICAVIDSGTKSRLTTLWRFVVSRLQLSSAQAPSSQAVPYIKALALAIGEVTECGTEHLLPYLEGIEVSAGVKVEHLLSHALFATLFMSILLFAELDQHRSNSHCRIAFRRGVIDIGRVHFARSRHPRKAGQGVER